ncbi:hypothetical protein AVEN_82450-1 [Araneus ventricosus]|uniref:Uncharacterized protein n=1 Tax=Araneus ventricosus TaxID=182803 RepID=A0A4Y2HTD9_ARAVE|nr:hypothetical protein AVEN_82450-1 [Araneus ventricosus]
MKKYLLAPGVSFSWFRRREKDFLPNFSENVDLVYCSNIPGLTAQFQIEYDTQEWRLFIDTCKRSLKAVLLHNGKTYASIPVGHSELYKECYENSAIILNKLKYKDHMLNISGNLKVIAMRLGLQGGNTKYPCFLCEWDRIFRNSPRLLERAHCHYQGSLLRAVSSRLCEWNSRKRSQHWIKREWPVRQKLEIGSKNVIEEALVDRGKILLPPLHIKLGLIKQFVKALDKDGWCFKHLFHAFPRLSAAKVKEGVFVGPDIRKLLKKEKFEACMTKVEKEA